MITASQLGDFGDEAGWSDGEAAAYLTVVIILGSLWAMIISGFELRRLLCKPKIKLPPPASASAANSVAASMDLNRA